MRLTPRFGVKEGILVVLIIVVLLEVVFVGLWETPRFRTSHVNSPPLQVAFCVIGQLERLELQSKIEHVFLPTATHAVVDAFLILTTGVGADSPLFSSEYQNEKELKKVFISYPHFGNVISVSKPSLAVRFKQQQNISVLEEMHKNTERCMQTITQRENERGVSYDIIVKLNDDVFAAKPIDFTRTQSGGFPVLRCAKEMREWVWVLDRKGTESAIMTGNAFLRKALLASNKGELTASLVSMSLCDFLLVPSNFQNGTRCILKEVKEQLKQCGDAKEEDSLCEVRIPICNNNNNNISSQTTTTTTTTTATTTTATTTNNTITTISSPSSISPRIFCIVPLSPKHRCKNWTITQNIISVLENTWGKHLDFLKFVIAKKTMDFMTQTKQILPKDLINAKGQTRYLVVDVDDGVFLDNCTTEYRRHRWVPQLWPKLVAALKLIASDFIHEADFFCKVDPDNFLAVENLRRFLSFYSPNEEIYIGRTILSGWEAHNLIFNHGMAYVLSRAALEKLNLRFKFLDKPPPEARDHIYDMRCEERAGRNEDSNLGICMRDINIFPINTLTSSSYNQRFALFSTGGWTKSRFDVLMSNHSDIKNNISRTNKNNNNHNNVIDIYETISIHACPCWSTYDYICFKQWMEMWEKNFSQADQFFSLQQLNRTTKQQQQQQHSLSLFLHQAPSPLYISGHNMRWEYVHNYISFPLHNLSLIHTPYAYHKPFSEMTESEFLQRRLGFFIDKIERREKDVWVRLPWNMPSENFELVFVPNSTSPFLLSIGHIVKMFPLHLGKEIELSFPSLSSFTSFAFAALPFPSSSSSSSSSASSLSSVSSSEGIDFYLPCGASESESEMKILRWKRGDKSMEFISGPPLPSARNNCSTLALGGAVCTFGGRNLSAVHSLCECYFPEEKKWISLPSFPLPLQGASVVRIPPGACGGPERILVFDSESGFIYELKIVRVHGELHITQSEKWTKRGRLERSNATPVVGGGGKFIYLYGGVMKDGTMVTKVDVYDTCSSSWLPKPVGSLLVARKSSRSTRGLFLRMNQVDRTQEVEGLDPVDFVVTCGTAKHGFGECEAMFLGDVLARTLSQQN